MIILMKRQTKTILISVFLLAVLCVPACGKDEANSTITLHTDPIPGDRVGYAPDLVCRYLLVGDKLTLYYYFDTQETAFTYTKVKT